MKRKLRQVLFGVMIASVFYGLYFLIIDIKATSQLKVIEGKNECPVTNLFKVSADRITAHSITYNKNEFIEYDCCIDSLYLIHAVKLGKANDSIALNNSISFSPKNDFPLGKGSFYVVAIPAMMSNIFIDFVSFYDVRLLPNIDIEKISIYIDGELIKKDTITNNILSCTVKASSISYAFNHSKKENMISISKYSSNPVISKLIFYKMPDGLLYIINVSRNDEIEPDIADIFYL